MSTNKSLYTDCLPGPFKVINMIGLDIYETVDDVSGMDHDGHQGLYALPVVMAHGTAHQTCQGIEPLHQSISGVNEPRVGGRGFQGCCDLSVKHDLDL